MKKFLCTLAIGLASLTSYAQGTVNFDNSPYSTDFLVDAPIVDQNGTRLAGTNFFAQIYAGTDSDAISAVGPVATFYDVGTGKEGYVNPSGQTVTIPNVPPGGLAYVQIRVWMAAASWETAFYQGQTVMFQVITGGIGDPPSNPGLLLGLQNTVVLVPEPSTTLLAFLGVGILIHFRGYRFKKS